MYGNGSDLDGAGGGRAGVRRGQRAAGRGDGGGPGGRRCGGGAGADHGGGDVPVVRGDGAAAAQRSGVVAGPAGVGNGQRIRLKGQGTPGENGGPNGDLWLVIHIAPHPLFDIVGQDLEIVVPVSPWEAALGAKVTVPTLTESILLTIPPGSQAGQRLRVKGKGLVSKKQTGDLYAVLKIVMPPKPDENTAALWQQLADAQSSFDPRKDWGKA